MDFDFPVLRVKCNDEGKKLELICPEKGLSDVLCDLVYVYSVSQMNV